jgi:hypothetical protein
MTKTYTVRVQVPLTNTKKDIAVTCENPMAAHRAVFFKTRQDEDIVCILDDDGNVVYDMNEGFKQKS